MTDFFKYDNYSLFEVGEVSGVINNQQFIIDISNNHENARFDALILVTVKSAGDGYATYVVNNDVNSNYDGKATNLEIRLTNKAISGKGSTEQENNIDYLIFYYSIMYNTYKYINNNLFKIFFGEISSFDEEYDINYCYFIMPRTMRVDIKNTNIGVMLNNSGNTLTAYGKYKDSRNGNDGGGDYIGFVANENEHDVPASIILLAIHRDISHFRHNNNQIIVVNNAFTSNNGTSTVSHSITLPYIILLSVVTTSQQ